MARILVIDDDESVRNLLRTIFEERGYEVDQAEGGDDGLNRHLSAPADVVITDLFMPKGEGLETTLKLRRLDNPPEVIVITGGGQWYSESYLETAKKLGATTVLKKPFSNQAIISAVEKALKKKCGS